MPIAGHSPPPFFRRGPTLLAKLLVLGAIAIAMAVVDARLHYLDWLRLGIATITQPVQRILSAPFSGLQAVLAYFAEVDTLRTEQARLRQRDIERAARVADADRLEVENGRLRALLSMRTRMQQPARVAEIVASTRDPFTRRVLLDVGGNQGIESGEPVIDELGVVGQVTRVYPQHGEVRLVTDRDQGVPVQVVRTGLRAVVFGAGGGQMELRFLAANVDVQVGDTLVTSGLDGLYPPGLAVARVLKVDRDADPVFARIRCQPIAAVEHHRHVLVLSGRAAETSGRPALAEEAIDAPARTARKGRSR